MEYKLSVECEADIRGIYRHSSDEFGADQAASYHLALEQAFDLIAANPAVGRIRPDIDDMTRSLVCQSHTIYYQLEDRFVLILRVLHGRQDPARHL